MHAAFQWPGLAPPSPSLSPVVRPSPQLPFALAPKVWRGSELATALTAAVSSGFHSLDAELPGGGWPCLAVTEVLQPQPSLCEWRLLGPCLRRIVADGGQVILVGPAKQPHLPGLQHEGIGPDNLVWIEAATPSERLWSTEQLVKANPKGAVLSWLPQARPEQLRRLQVHAQSCESPVFLMRPSLAQNDPSPAPLRVLAALGRDWTLEVRILKRRGAALDETITLPSFPGGLSAVLTPRMLRPSVLSPQPADVVLGSPARRERVRELAGH